MADYSREQLVAALRKADAAGDEAAARAIARRIKGMEQPTPRSETDPSLWAGGKVPSTDPTEGMGGFERFVAAYGSAAPSMARGGRQLLTDMASFITPFYVRGGLAPEQARLRQEAGEVAALEQPLMGTKSGMLGRLAGSVAPMFATPGGAAFGATRAAPYMAAATEGAAFGALQPVAEGESRAANTAIGGGLGVLGQGIAGQVQKAAGKAVDAMSPVVRQSIESARAAGIPLNVAQVTNSAPVRALQAASKYLPFAGASKGAKAQQEAFNRAVGRSFGADAPQLTEDVMKAARNRLSQTFDDIYTRNDVELGPDVVRRMAAIEREAFEDLTQADAQVVRNQLDKVLREAGDGILTGQKYQALRSALQKAEDGGKIGRLVRKMRNELDDAAAASVSADDAARLAQVRSQWANLRTAEDALKQVSGAAGDIRPASLYPLIRKGATREMRELAKIGQNVLKEGIGDSGTAQRAMYQNLLTGGAGLAAAGAGLGKLVLGGALAGRALNSNAASKLLQQGRPTQGLARLVQPAPKLLPAATPAIAPVMDIGTVSGYDPSDPRYRGD
jgi:hypothetical protein